MSLKTPTSTFDPEKLQSALRGLPITLPSPSECPDSNDSQLLRELFTAQFHRLKPLKKHPPLPEEARAAGNTSDELSKQRIRSLEAGIAMVKLATQVRFYYHPHYSHWAETEEWTHERTNSLMINYRLPDDAKVSLLLRHRESYVYQDLHNGIESNLQDLDEVEDTDFSGNFTVTSKRGPLPLEPFGVIPDNLPETISTQEDIQSEDIGKVLSVGIGIMQAIRPDMLKFVRR